MKENLKIEEFSLKRIVENLHKIPSRGKLQESFGEQSQKLSSEQKASLREKIANFNKYGDVLRCEVAIKELAKNLKEISNLAEQYAMTEASDYFQQEIIQRDFKQMKNVNKAFEKLANECYGKLMELNALYEDHGKLLERYFEVKSLDEIAKAVGAPIGECGDCGCGRPNDNHGMTKPTKEISELTEPEED
jgi:hypothetical protein